MANVDELPSNIQIVSLDGKPTQAFVFYLQKLQTVTEKGSADVISLQSELNATQIGAGLNTGGNYVPSGSSNYINSATSLFTADLLLDSAIFNNTRAFVTVITGDASLLPLNQSILVDATAGAVNITLPSPTDSFSTNRSYKIAIQKIDTSANVVNILPNATELVVGETSQTLNIDGEVLNLIADGINWYLEN